jgi:hypothetical protein
MRATLGAVLMLTLVPIMASAASIEDILRLTGAGVSEEVILAVIERDKTIFSLGSDDLVTLRARGVSERVLLAMLKSGRDEAEAALQRENEQRTAEFANAALEGPTVIIIGHGPDRPNTGRYDWYFPYPFAGLYSPAGLYSDIVVAPPLHHGMAKDGVYTGTGLPSCTSGLTVRGVGSLAMPPCSSAMIPVQPRQPRHGRIKR